MTLIAEEADTILALKPSLKDLTLHIDDRGWLFEGVHSYELPPDPAVLKTRDMGEGMAMASAPPRFGQVYVVHSRTRGTVRAFHRHRVLWDFFIAVRGSAKFVVAKGDYKQYATLHKGVQFGLLLHEPKMEVVLTLARPQLLTVPPGWYHGWMALEDETTILSVGSELYNREAPDEERIPYDALGADIWEVKYH